MKTIDKIEKQLSDFPIVKIKSGFKIGYKRKKLKYLSFEMRVSKLIFPLREGEFIKDIHKLPVGKEYSLSYPGTASTKTMVLFEPENNGGIFIGGGPTFEFAKIKIKRINGQKLLITYYSPEHTLYFINFNNGWRLAADQYKDMLGLETDKRIKRKPKYFLQIGVKDTDKTCHIKHFSDLKPLVDYFHKELGPGHIIHFFGTTEYGYDRMAPDYTIDPGLGGKEAFIELVKYIQQKGFLTSHHYNPRIADNNWVRKHPEYKKAVVMKKGDGPVIEEYKGQDHYFMNPNNDLWFNRCMETVKYLKSIGFDYIQLDQFTYQRNFYNSDKPIQLGYKKMIEEFYKLDIKFWLEGLSDIHLIEEGNFYQILTRNIPQVWEDNESRRGYPHGVSYPAFFMYLYPNIEVSFQLVTEKNSLTHFERRLNLARKINTCVYDLQMTFYGEKYMEFLKKLINKIKTYDQPKKNWHTSLPRRLYRRGIFGNLKKKKSI